MGKQISISVSFRLRNTLVLYPPLVRVKERKKVGTAPYTATELITLGAERNFPSDVYSMGMVMIEVTLPGQSHPWEGEVSSSDLIFYMCNREDDLQLFLTC